MISTLTHRSWSTTRTDLCTFVHLYRNEARMSDIEIPTGSDTRLVVRTWDAATGRRLATVAPQYRDRTGAWRLQHSGLSLLPDSGRELAPALLAVAATIDGSPPEPTTEGRDESRWP